MNGTTLNANEVTASINDRINELTASAAKHLEQGSALHPNSNAGRNNANLYAMALGGIMQLAFLLERLDLEPEASRRVMDEMKAAGVLWAPG